MKILKPEEIKKLASTIMIEVTDETANELHETLKKTNEQFETFSKFDVNKLNMKSYPLERFNTQLRNDEDVRHLDHDLVIKSAHSSEDGYIKITKVVK